MKRKIRTLLFSTLYPSAVRPVHGIFVETRLRELLKTGEVETRVVAPVPWFPSRHARFGSWAKLAQTPPYEERNGVRIWHPRYLLLPKIGMSLAPFTLAAGALSTIEGLIRDGFDFDLIDAHYYFPDGVAAALLARKLRKPFVVTARGTDLNLIPQYAIPRRLIRWTAQQAAASIGVSQSLVDVLRELEAPVERLVTMRNGVDLERFRPKVPSDCRAALGISADVPIVLSVGHLVERKGNHILIDAVARLRDEGTTLQVIIVGDGEERHRLEAQAASAGLGARVKFVGAIPNDQLSTWYSAADVLVLASSREGWANVLLESMACGTPVVATRIWGTPEVVRDPVAGELFEPRAPAALALALRRLLARLPDRSAVRAYAEAFGWQPTSDAQLRLFGSLASRAGLAVAGTA